MKQETRKAILVVSFGTSYEPTRKVTIDAIEKEIADAFPPAGFTAHGPAGSSLQSSEGATDFPFIQSKRLWSKCLRMASPM